MLSFFILKHLMRLCDPVWMMWDAWMWCRPRSMPTLFFFPRPLNAFLDCKSSLIPDQWRNGGVVTQLMWQCGTVLTVNESQGGLRQSFPGISELCQWPERKCVSLHESLMVWQVCATFSLSSWSLCKTAVSLSFCRCALVVLHPLSLTLSFSPRSICASVTRQRGDSWANSHLRCSAASPLTRLSWESGVCRLLCSLWPTQPMAR